jgi:hypothetical protein
MNLNRTATSTHEPHPPGPNPRVISDPQPSISPYDRNLRALALTFKPRSPSLTPETLILGHRWAASTPHPRPHPRHTRAYTRARAGAYTLINLNPQLLSITTIQPDKLQPSGKV